MRNLILVSLFYFVIFSAFGQKTKKIHLGDKNYYTDYEVLVSNENVKHGSYKEFLNGKLFTEGFYENGAKNGHWKFYKDGNLFYETYYENDLPTLDKIYSFDTLSTIVYYKNGLKHGEQISTYGNQKPQYVSNYLDGKLDGVSLFYNRKGEIINRTYYKNGLKNGTEEVFKAQKTIRFAEYSDDKLNGTIKNYYDNGQLMHEISFKNGEPLQKIQAFTYNGEVDENTTLDNGIGRLVTYYPDGKIYTDFQFKNGLLDGEQKSYNANGSIYYKENYKEGEIQGFVEKYDSQGVLREKGLVEKGYKVGKWTVLDEGNGGNQTKKYDVSDQIKYYSLLVINQRPNSDPLYTVVEDMPQFPGDMTGLANFLRNNVTYPEEEKKNDIEGISYVQFVIDQRGYVTDVKIYPGTESKATENMHKESIRVISLMPRWTPGFQRGKAVKVSYSIPIRYKLR